MENISSRKKGKGLLRKGEGEAESAVERARKSLVLEEEGESAKKKAKTSASEAIKVL